MKKTVASIAIILAFAVSFAVAQMGPPHGDPAAHMQHHLAMLTKHLDLSAAQQQQATTIFTNAAASQTTIHNSLKTAHDGLSSAIKTNDTAAIDQAAATIGNLTAQMISNHAKAQAAFFQILTPDQQTKMSQMENQHPHFGGPEGMGRGAHPGKPPAE
jgi:Spy/CpxP family protein refolding chaperone